jgi:hypothetical protein
VGFCCFLENVTLALLCLFCLSRLPNAEKRAEKKEVKRGSDRKQFKVDEMVE